MNIVFFVDSYHGKASTNGVCVKKVADELVKQGHNVEVITAINEINQPKFEVVDGVNVHRIKRSTVYTFKLFVDNKTKCKNFFRKILVSYIRLRYCFLLWLWPRNSFFATLRYFNFAKRKLKGKKIDVIVGTYFHLEELLASLKFKKVSPNATHITYTLDAMAGRAVPKSKTQKIARSSIERWERYVLNRTDVFCAMQSHKNHFDNAGYDVKLLNKLCYVDIPLFDLQNKTNSKNKIQKTKKMVYTGYSNRDSGSVKYLVELMPFLENVEFHIYGAIDSEITDAIKKTKLLNKKIFFYGYVDYNVVSAAQNTADFLVTAGSINPCMISGKIFDYFGKKKPIIAFYQIENDSNLPYLQKYPNVIFIKDCNENLKTDVERLNRFLQKKDFVEIQDEFLINEFYKNTPTAMAELINHLRGGRK